jgi:hypothetical protein
VVGMTNPHSELSDLGHLIGGEDRRRFVPCGANLRSEGCLSIVRVGDCWVFGEGGHEACDVPTETLSDFLDSGVGILDHVMQHTCRHDSITAAGAVEQWRHFKRMDDERRAVRSAPLVAMQMTRETDRELGHGQIDGERGQRGSRGLMIGIALLRLQLSSRSELMFRI